MKMLYDDGYRTYGVWGKPDPKVEIASLSELSELDNKLDERGDMLIVLKVDKEKDEIIFGKYDGDY